ncbi:hypothetical protein B5C34_08665 [Pacificimonas flava]|uniref:Ferrous iron transporter FeoA-like domain-containing protein n=2 Tax=Pacificimonas TaxID=1960290 RepID=A0A219B570_9SPHN|nr:MULTISPECIES: FeoA family protein [Pacificimonas]MBZ6379265.1 ferrous iron transport protein A [Pacificimonas aurantium]OWV33525.1 hypothetical protein B5C34_08665 [Pacificimonas flava]
MLICDLRPGVRAVIDTIDAAPADEKRLREHGFDEGVEVELLHRAAFGADPVAVRVGNASVALRRSMAAHITVSIREGAELTPQAAE